MFFAEKCGNDIFIIQIYDMSNKTGIKNGKKKSHKRKVYISKPFFITVKQYVLNTVAILSVQRDQILSPWDGNELVSARQICKCAVLWNDVYTVGASSAAKVEILQQ